MTNPSPDDKTLLSSKLKAFADNKFIVAENVVPLPDKRENNVGKGESSHYEHFLLFLYVFNGLRVVTTRV